jgi:hypothetical protein
MQCTICMAGSFCMWTVHLAKLHARRSGSLRLADVNGDFAQGDEV